VGFVIYLLFACISVFAQEQKVVRDLTLWTEIKLTKSIVRDLQFSVSQHFRFNHNISGFEDYIAEAELEYSINKNFSIGTNGRFTKNEHYDQTIDNEYRYDLYFGYDTKILPKVKIFYRLKYQRGFYGSGVFNDYLNYNETTYRNRLKLGWEVHDHHRLYTSAEVFRLRKQSRDSYFSKYRVFLGDDIPTRIGVFDAAFGMEQQLHNLHPLTCYIFKIAYQFTL
jgi:hypothetical protein